MIRNSFTRLIHLRLTPKGLGQEGAGKITARAESKQEQSTIDKEFLHEAHTPEIDSQRLGARGGRKAPVRSVKSQPGQKASRSKVLIIRDSFTRLMHLRLTPKGLGQEGAGKSPSGQ